MAWSTGAASASEPPRPSKAAEPESASDTGCSSISTCQLLLMTIGSSQRVYAFSSHHL